jgi:hypothetical protein
MEAVQKADERVAKLDRRQDARGRRIEIDRQDAWPSAALTAALLARHDGCGPTGALGHPDNNGLEAAAQRRRCARKQRRGRLGLALRHGIALGVDERVEMIVPDQQRAGERDRNQQNRTAEAQPKMDVQP